MVDYLFDPATVPLPRGGTVVFDFEGPSHHTATDGSGLELYDSGSVEPPMGPLGCFICCLHLLTVSAWQTAPTQ